MELLADYFYVQLRRSLKVALPLEHTTEVISILRGDICPVPGMIPALLGVVNQRGRLLWVLDLSDLLKLPADPKPLRSQDPLTLVIMSASSDPMIADKSKPQVGCVVSALKGITTLNPIDFKPLPTKVPAPLSLFLSAVVEIERSPVALLDTDAVLSALQTSIPSYSSATLP